jgi:hypothetical protein
MRYSKTHPSGMAVFKEGQKTGFTVGKLAHYMTICKERSSL